MRKAVVLVLAIGFFVMRSPEHADLCYAQASQSDSTSDLKRNEPGLWSFAISDPNVISRSGQPSIKGFRWLKDNGWKSIVDLRAKHDDTKIKGFNKLHFKYLALPIVDFSIPSDKQVQEFLNFVTDPRNQPVHVHCHEGIGRTGVMIALYRYMVQGWPIDKAINESELFHGGPDKIQKTWLRKWAQTHKPGSYKNFKRP